MIGIGLIIFILIWGSAAVWLGKLLSRTVFVRFTTNSTTGKPSAKGDLIKFMLIAFVFLLPILDQIIAYPKWQQLCATTGDFEWGLGMNERTAVGREVTAKYEYHRTTIFPNIKVEYSSESIFDAKTHELIYRKPHFRYSARAFMYLPAGSGNKSASFLTSCVDYSVMVNGEDFSRKILTK